MGAAVMPSRRGRGPLGEVRAAIAFLTRLPVAASAEEPARTGAAAFALVGTGLGLAAAAPLLLLGARLPWAAAVLAVATLAIAAGVLHLDGLADTADALAAPTPEAAERARTDPRTGAAGVVAIVLDIVLAVALLEALVAADPALGVVALVVACAGSRAAPVVAAWVAGGPGGGLRTDRAGLGGWFAANVGLSDVVAAIATTVLVAATAGLVTPETVAPGLLAVGLGGGAIVGGLLGAVVVGRRGGLDGDGYGAIVELVFLAILAAFAIQAAA
jgi:adenosylcobinamide-GDP ribazoletransferase